MQSLHSQWGSNTSEHHLCAFCCQGNAEFLFLGQQRTNLLQDLLLTLQREQKIPYLQLESGEGHNLDFAVVSWDTSQGRSWKSAFDSSNGSFNKLPEPLGILIVIQKKIPATVIFT